MSTIVAKSHSDPQKLLNKNWISIEMGKPRRNTPGIYMIGIKILQFYNLARYLGRSKDIRRRLNQHMQPSQRGKQKIDDFIQNQPKDSIVVKWVEEPNHKYVEGQYLNYVENELGYKLKYNMKAGDGATRSTDLPDVFLSRKGKQRLFRPSAEVCCFIRTFKQKRLRNRRGPQCKDRRLIRRIIGTEI